MGLGNAQVYGFLISWLTPNMKTMKIGPQEQ